MSAIRPLEAADLKAVAQLFERVFRQRDGVPPESLTAYLDRLFLNGPWAEPDLRSLVHCRADGAVSGFMGVVPLPLDMGGRRLRGAMCGTLMVDGREEDPLAGARLMRSFLSGPQDVSLSETASDVSAGMWTKLRGTVLRDYSLTWLRILRPGGFLVARARERSGLAAPLSALMRPLDTALMRKAGRAEPKWWAHGGDGAEKFSDEPVSAEAVAGLIPGFLEGYAIRPDWRPDVVRAMLEDAAHKARPGPFTQRVVKAPSGVAVGVFLYHGRPGGIAEALQIFAKPRQAGVVLERLFAHAAEAGCVAVTGRSQPQLLDGLLGKKVFLTHKASTVMHTKDPEIAAAFAANGAFLNGLAGESWSRLIGDDFI